MAEIMLNFSGRTGNLGAGETALDELSFSHPLLPAPRTTRRGRGALEIYDWLGACGTFQWTSAVQALSILILRSKAWQATSLDDASSNGTGVIPVLSGDTGTLAASLDYALSKRPLWLMDMFGTDKQGESVSRRLFLRWNAERKRGGDVTISLNRKQLSYQQIEIRVGGVPLQDPARCLELAEKIESAVKVRRGSRTLALVPGMPPSATDQTTEHSGVRADGRTIPQEILARLLESA